MTAALWFAFGVVLGLAIAFAVCAWIVGEIVVGGLAKAQETFEELRASVLERNAAPPRIRES